MNDIDGYLLVGAALFVLGAVGFLTRRNLILMVLSAELMLHGVSLTFVTFSRLHQNQQGLAFTVFILTVAACEAGLALALVLSLYQRRKTLDVDVWSRLRESDLPPPSSDAFAPPVEMGPTLTFPQLTPAGRSPQASGARPAAAPPQNRPRPEETATHV